MLRSSLLSTLLFGVVLTACASSADDTPAVADDDVTRGCTPGGLYCGGDGVRGDARTLYRCDGAALAVVETCPSTCVVNPSPKKDACKATHGAAEASALVKAFYAKGGGAYAPAGSKVLTPELAYRIAHPVFVPGQSAPFVCAQNVPDAAVVGVTTLDGEDALVTVLETFGSQTQNVVVRVRLSDLTIAGWRCGAPKHTATEAHTAVRSFYGTYGPSPASRRDGVASDYAKHLAAMPFRPGDGDPFTCEQAEPDFVSVDPALEMGELAVMTVRESFGDTRAQVAVATDLDDLRIHGTMCAPFDDGGWWSR